MLEGLRDHVSSISTRGMTPGSRLKEARARAGLTVQDLAQRTGLTPSAIRAHESNQNGIRAETAELYSKALGIAPEFLLYGRTKEQHARVVPVVGEVQAGVWSEVPEQDPEAHEWVPFFDPAYNRARLFALSLKGTSMNRIYSSGGIVICAPVTDAGLVEGDHAVVRRSRGGLTETTLKEVVVGVDGALELWPRSDDPRFQEPIVIHKEPDADEGVEIIGIVVGAYKRGPDRSGPRIF